MPSRSATSACKATCCCKSTLLTTPSQLQNAQGGQSAEEEDSNRRLAPNTPQGEALLCCLQGCRVLSKYPTLAPCFDCMPVVRPWGR